MLILQEGCYVSLYNHDEGYGQGGNLQGGWQPVGSAEDNEELELELKPSFQTSFRCSEAEAKSFPMLSWVEKSYNLGSNQN